MGGWPRVRSDDYFRAPQAPHFFAAHAPHFLAAQAPHFFLAAHAAHFRLLQALAVVLQRARQAAPAQPTRAAAVTTAVARVRDRSRANELMGDSRGG
jgi:hypothetical protein